MRAETVVLALAIAALAGCQAGPRTPAAGGGADQQEPVAKPPTPIADGERFSAEITNPYLPLSLVRYTELQGEEGWVVRAVAERTRTVAGVECLVLVEQEYQGGVLVELSTNYLAQDGRGNVWYFGEAVDEYEAGGVIGHDGSWMVGVDVAEPGLIMPAVPRKGQRFKPEDSPPGAEEFDEIDAVDVELSVPLGRFQGVVVVKEGDRPGEWKERKYYAPGVGLISENTTLNLSAVGSPGPGTP